MNEELEQMLDQLCEEIKQQLWVQLNDDIEHGDVEIDKVNHGVVIVTTINAEKAKYEGLEVKTRLLEKGWKYQEFLKIQGVIFD